MNALEAFKILETEFGDTFQLNEDLVFVEEVIFEEIKTKSGLVLSNADAFGEMANGLEKQRAPYARVLKVGLGTVDYPQTLKVGDIITTGPNSILYYMTLFNTTVCKPRIGIARAREALVVLREGAYEKIGARYKELMETKS